MSRKFDKKDILAIIIVVGLYLVMPFLAFILIVAGYGIVSSTLRYAAWHRPRDAAAALLWAAVFGVDLVAIAMLVKWYKS